MSAYDAVTFDYWDTLLQASPGRYRQRRLDVWEAALTEAQLGLGRDEIDASFDRLLDEFNRRWRANEVFSAADAAKWAADDLGLPDVKQLRAHLTGAFLWPGDDMVPELTPNVVDALQALTFRGVRVGIICDVGMTPSTSLRRWLDHHGILELFDHWSFSDEVGCYKPDPRIYAHALEGLGVEDPARAAHVGDLRWTDATGARAFGMTAVRYAGANDDAPHAEDPEDPAHHVIDDHAELLGVLGLS